MGRLVRDSVERNEDLSFFTDIEHALLNAHASLARLRRQLQRSTEMTLERVDEHGSDYSIADSVMCLHYMACTNIKIVESAIKRLGLLCFVDPDLIDADEIYRKTLRSCDVCKRQNLHEDFVYTPKCAHYYCNTCAIENYISDDAFKCMICNEEIGQLYHVARDTENGAYDKPSYIVKDYYPVEFSIKDTTTTNNMFRLDGDDGDVNDDDDGSDDYHANIDDDSFNDRVKNED